MNMTSTTSRQPRQDGFTLIEAVIVIVITAVIGAMVATFIRLPVQGYADTAARAELTDIADSALRRIARDLRLALPNSVRTATDASTGKKYIELLLTKTGGRYLAAEDGVGGNILDFDNAGATTFTVVGWMPTGSQAIAANDFIVVYNLGPGFPPADAYDCSVVCNRAQVASVDTTNNLVTLTSNAFANQSATPPPGSTTPVTMRSPSMRFQVVSTPVTYECDPAGHTLKRYWNYAIQATQPTSAAALATAPSWATPASALLATNVQDCTFSYASLQNVRSALVTLDILLSNPNSAGAGTVELRHQVHVDNIP